MNEAFRRFAHTAARWTGSVFAFSIALMIVLVWAITGPIFGFSDTWQLVINTGTTVVTFLMVFLIQNTQNRDSQAIHAKLDELVVKLAPADNRLVQAEEMTEDELKHITKHFHELAEEAEEEATEAVTEATDAEREAREARTEAIDAEHKSAGAKVAANRAGDDTVEKTRPTQR